VAITVKAEQVKYLVAEMLKDAPTSLVRLQALQEAGWNLTVGLFHFVLSKGDAAYVGKATASLSAFPTLPPAQKQVVTQVLVKTIDSVWDTVGGTLAPEGLNPCAEIHIPTAQAVPPVTGYDAGSGDTAASFLYTTPLPQKKEVVSEKPVPDVLPLREAKAIRQKVFGTSEGSVYTTVAIGPVNMAVRVTSGKVSIRAEYPEAGESDITKQLVALGFSNNGKYLSMHIVLSGVPAERVIGSMLYAVGVQFNSIATSKEDFV
jgi:hypothetical protein